MPPLLGDSEEDQKSATTSKSGCLLPAFQATAYCGERLNARRLLMQTYECAIRMMGVLALVNRGGMK